ncbi:MAG: hypothetical protein CMJ78_14080 [Planctomycetaceae bacterium]|nr:hypothetical protein [Planctomycetaceae bacterium]
MSQLVTISTFSTQWQASIVRSQLEEEGITTFLSDSEAIGMAWHLRNALGGVKLQVADQDVERALSLLEESPPSERGDPRDAGDQSLDEEFVQERSVRQFENAPDQFARRAMISAVLGLIFFRFRFIRCGCWQCLPPSRNTCLHAVIAMSSLRSSLICQQLL